MVTSLPCDVLGEIFAHYALSEDLFHPLETLLLVSRFWHEAALIYGEIWATFNIEIGNYKSIHIWRTRVGRRLARVGPTRLLDITIRNVYSVPNHPSASDFLNGNRMNQKEPISNLSHNIYQVRHFMLDFLQDLNGRDGSLTWRWRSLHLYFGDHPWNYDRGSSSEVTRFSWKVLSYPTPALESLTLEYIETNGNDRRRRHPLLPFSPNLRTCTLSEYSFSFYPDISAAREVTIIHPRHLQNTTNRPRFKLGMAVEKLVLGLPFNGEWTLPQTLPQLRSIEVGKGGPQCNLEDLKAPHLTQATLRIQNAFFLPNTLLKVSFLSAVTHLTILDEASTLILPAPRLSISRILSAILSLVHLRTNEAALRGVLALVKDSRSPQTNPDGTFGDVDLSTCPFQLRRLRVSCVEFEGDAEISSDMDSWVAVFRILRASTLYTQNPDIAKMIEGLTSLS
ncbi:hypothetical protein PIIN_08327 [Serendipita indica DSM 11827]|uniref:F-box domain-containing protein n=1 Tax=Serendipita indica (strain DSM 11827) TaxID=1109443 RepID=G4TST1_SERID|nr:hypothetical protein PIIN_08327 [Serendipita indica DSM 11827]